LHPFRNILYIAAERFINVGNAFSDKNFVWRFLTSCVMIFWASVCRADQAVLHFSDYSLFRQQDANWFIVSPGVGLDNLGGVYVTAGTFVDTLGGIFGTTLAGTLQKLTMSFENRMVSPPNDRFRCPTAVGP
jgi:hypothetical protein